MKTKCGPFVRKALAADVPRLLELVHELALFERAPEEVTVTVEEFTMAGFGLNPVYKAWVLEEDHQIQGFALCYTRYSTWKGSRLYLEDLLVTKQKRNLNYGTMLFEACLDEVEASGLSGLVWQVLDWNVNALRFYQKYHCHIDDSWLNCSLNLDDIQRKSWILTPV